MQESEMSRFSTVSTAAPGAAFTPGRARRFALPALAVVLATLMGGCASDAARVSNVRYDLGPLDTMSLTALAPAQPVRVLDVSAPDAFDTDKFVYRLAYADAQRIDTYRDSRWTAPPAQLLTQRLRAALSAKRAVLEGADRVRGAPVLRVELNEFERVFDGQSQSHASVAVRATLTRDGALLGQRSFTARAPSSTPDAAGGAGALAAASNELVAQLTAWLAMQTTAAQ